MEAVMPSPWREQGENCSLRRQRFPELVRYDSTPIHKALWRIATRCGGAVYQNPSDRAFYY